MNDRTDRLFAPWGKTEPFHPLVCHLVDAGQVARVLLESGTFSANTERLQVALGLTRGEPVVPWLSYVVALHDIGKCHADFQAKGPQELIVPIRTLGLECSAQAMGFRHEAFGALWAREFLSSEWALDRRSAGTIAAVIAAHHGDFRPENPMPETPSRQVAWDELRRSLEREVRSVFAPVSVPPRFSDQSVVGLQLAGLVVLSDWIASNREIFPCSWDHEDLADYARKSRDVAEKAVFRLGFATAPLEPGTSFAEVWRSSGFQPRPIQACAEAIVAEGLEPGLAIIEAPMGEGKTEAAVYLATQWARGRNLSGMYIGLPTAATSNQMYGRIRAFLASHDPLIAEQSRLVHGMAWLLDESTPQTGPALDDVAEERLALDWFRPKKRALLAAYGIGTVDQALMAALQVKHGFLRLFGLAGKILVVDEVHAYDAYMSEILTRLLNWCAALGIPVILLSATLPASRRRALAEAYSPAAGTALAQSTLGNAYPLITLVPSSGEATHRAVAASGRSLRIYIERHPGLLLEPDGTAALVADRVKESGGCHAVIVNTVGGAQEVYRSLKARLAAAGRSDVELLLFHSRFPAGRRQVVEQQALAWFDRRSLLSEGNEARARRPHAAVLVATQVVEQSLDLDFDELYTQLAPVDLLLQRVGRLHRHDRPQRPTGPDARLHLLLPEAHETDFGATEKVYERYILLMTLLALNDETWRLPEDIRPLVESVYGDAGHISVSSDSLAEEELKLARARMEERRGREGREAEQYLIPPPSPRRFTLADPQPQGPFDEDEGGAASYFAAKTRLGDDSQQVLLLETDRFREELARTSAPPRSVLRELLLTSVNLPRWWFPRDDFLPLQDHEPIIATPDWLGRYLVLRLQEGKWTGRAEKGEPVTIRSDPELGVLRERGGP